MVRDCVRMEALKQKEKANITKDCRKLVQLMSLYRPYLFHRLTKLNDGRLSKARILPHRNAKDCDVLSAAMSAAFVPIVRFSRRSPTTQSKNVVTQPFLLLPLMDTKITGRYRPKETSNGLVKEGKAFEQPLVAL